MSLLKSQAKGMFVGFTVLVLWSSLDWFASKHGLPFGQTRNYIDTFFAATAGAGVVFIWRDA